MLSSTTISWGADTPMVNVTNGKKKSRFTNKDRAAAVIRLPPC